MVKYLRNFGVALGKTPVQLIGSEDVWFSILRKIWIILPSDRHLLWKGWSKEKRKSTEIDWLGRRLVIYVWSRPLHCFPILLIGCPEISDSPSLIELYSEILRLILGKQKLQQVEVSLRICYHSFAQTKIGFVDPQLTVRGWDVPVFCWVGHCSCDTNFWDHTSQNLSALNALNCHPHSWC